MRKGCVFISHALLRTEPRRTWVRCLQIAPPIMAILKRILVASDFGEASGRALDLALGVAAGFGSELTLIHVWEFPSYEYLGGMPMPVDYAERMNEAVRARMAAVVDSVRYRCRNVKSIVKMGVPCVEVLRAVEETRSDLLVLGTHGRRGLRRAILGSVAEKLVRSCSVPVLTVHGSDEAR